VEAILIIVAAVLIIREAGEKLFHPSVFGGLGIGMLVMLVSAVVNYFISRYLMKVGKETDSMALQADALHLQTDVYTSLGVLAGLVLIKLTGLPILDPLVAIGVALNWRTLDYRKKRKPKFAAFSRLLCHGSLNITNCAHVNPGLSAISMFI
jgi:cation diffusion facilitator family transporter